MFLCQYIITKQQVQIDLLLKNIKDLKEGPGEASENTLLDNEKPPHY